MTIDFNIDDIIFDEITGLIPMITIDADSSQVLTLAYASRESLKKSVETKEMFYQSRSRGLWHKGETSGNIQHVVSLSTDCDYDAVVARVIPDGSACHNDTTSCFDISFGLLGELDGIVTDRKANFEGYVGKLLKDQNLSRKKIGEESAELVGALATCDRPQALNEAADLIFHVLIAVAELDIDSTDILRVLGSRRRGVKEPSSK